MPRTWKVCLVGAGGIAGSHAHALKSLPSVKITAVVDPNLAAATRLAKTWGIETICADPTEVLADAPPDVVHILVQPPLHKDVALPYIRAGCHVFLEKPMCLSLEEAAALKGAAEERGVMIGVNHNLCFTQAHLKVRALIRSNRLGRIHHLCYVWNVDLPLLAKRKYGHWMFESRRNIFFELAPHPLSQIYDLVGAVRTCDVSTSEPVALAPGIDLVDTWQVSMTCERATAQLFYSVAQEYPIYGMVIICENGVITANMKKNWVLVETSTPGLSFGDYRTALAMGRQAWRQAGHHLVDELKAKFRLGPSADPFVASMRNSIGSFYGGLEGGKVPVDADFGTEVVRMCERVTKNLVVPKIAAEPAPAPKREQAQPADVAVFGGTGLIGRHVIARLVAAGMRVNVMAREARGLPEVFYHELVRCVPGDVSNPEAVERVIADAPYVIDLAFSFGDGSWDYMEEVGIGGARHVGECCLRRKVRRLVYTSTINVLDMSSAGLVIKDSTGPDPKFWTRSGYSKMKTICEHLLMDMHREKALSVCILRPGIVIGEDNNPYHAGVAAYNSKQIAECHSNGTHPLPFVLVKDVAEAFYLALTRPNADGKSYNLVGDVRLTAREYVTELSKIFERPIAFAAVPPWKAKADAVLRWALKLASGRSSPFPNFHEISCWGLYGRFDNQEIKQDLGWRPVADRETFIREGIGVHRKASRSQSR